MLGVIVHLMAAGFADLHSEMEGDGQTIVRVTISLEGKKALKGRA
jgi:hypothetical protein